MGLLPSILACSLLPCLAAAYPFYRSSQPYQYLDPEPCQGVCQSIHDPTIIRKDNKYYRFITGGRINIATAKSISGPWEEKGVLLENGQKIFANTTCDGDGVVGVDCFDVWVSEIEFCAEEGSLGDRGSFLQCSYLTTCRLLMLVKLVTLISLSTQCRK